MSDYIHPYMAYYVLVILASSVQFIYLLAISVSSVSCEDVNISPAQGYQIL